MGNCASDGAAAPNECNMERKSGITEERLADLERRVQVLELQCLGEFFDQYDGAPLGTKCIRAGCNNYTDGFMQCQSCILREAEDEAEENPGNAYERHKSDLNSRFCVVLIDVHEIKQLEQSVLALNCSPRPLILNWNREEAIQAYREQEMLNTFGDQLPSALLIRGCVWQDSAVETLCQDIKRFVAAQTCIVIGWSENLEKHLENDIRFASHALGLNPEEVLLDMSAHPEQTKFEIIGGTRNGGWICLQVIVEPTVMEFQQIITSLVANCTAPEFTLLFCGHGASNGTISLFGEDYSGTEFLSFLHDLQFQHFPQVVIVLNCCYGMHFVAGLLERAPSEVMDLWQGFCNLNSAWKSKLETVLKFKRDRDIAQAELFLKVVRKMGKFRSPFLVKVGNLSVYLWPLSVADIPASGHVHAFYGGELSLASGTIARRAGTSKRVPWYQDSASAHWQLRLMTLTAAERAEPCCIAYNVPRGSPSIQVFQARYGDSALVRYNQFSVLVDGGLSVENICYWQAVKSLDQLDLMILTHGDADHVNGLLPLLYGIKHGKVAANWLRQVLSISLEQVELDALRTWFHTNLVRNLADECKIPFVALQATDTQAPISLGADLCIQVIWPDKHHIQTAQTNLRLQFHASLSDSPQINECSLVVCIKFGQGPDVKHALFTGDSDGKDVLTALRTHGLTATEFDYIDMPHHGSKDNHPSELLATIKTKRIGVSTSGLNYGHPDGPTLEALCGYLRQHTQTELFFNYQTHKVYPKKTRLVEVRAFLESQCSQAERAQIMGRVHTEDGYTINL